MAYLRLKDHWLLRGWERLPHALVDDRQGHSHFVDNATFQTLSLCDGTFQAGNPVLLPVHQQILKALQQHGIIEGCDSRHPISDRQCYRRYPCRHMPKAHWSVTGRCNYHCRHCYMSAPEAKYGELSLTQCLRIVDQLSEAGVFQVSLTGGEPLFRPDFLDIVDALRDKGIHISQIYSNGALVNETLLDALEARGLQPEFSISFDGLGHHDWLRGVVGAESSAIDALRLLHRRGFPSSTEFSIHRGNRQSLEGTVLFLAELGVRSMKVTPTSEIGAWIQEGGTFTLGVEELYATYLDYLPKYRASGAPMNLMLSGFFLCRKGSEAFSIPCKKFDGSDRMRRQPLCRSARTTMYISADGRLLPCLPLTGLPIQEEMPSVLDMGLIPALSDSRYLQAIDTRLEHLLAHNDKCRTCQHALTCGGGCRAGALASGQGYLDVDEYTCSFFQNDYEAKIRAVYSSPLPGSG